MFDLEQAINKWKRQFSGHRSFEEGTMQEMELHLRDHIEDLINEGETESEAFNKAVNAFGNVPEVATEEYSVIRRKSTLGSIIYTTMLHNYFKTSFRTMLKNPMSSFINVFGLAVAIGISLVVYAFFVFDMDQDQFHEHKNEVYLSTFFVDRDGSEEQYGLSPAPLGVMLKQDYPQIKEMCRVADRRAVVKQEDKVFHEWIRTVDPSFLNLMTFPLKWGTSNSLEDVNSIILSHEMAVKYYGDENPIGQDLLLKFTETRSKTFTVTGVATPFPKAHIIEFDFLINLENLSFITSNLDMNDWSDIVNATLIRVDDPQDLLAIQKGMEKYQKLQNEVEKNWAITSFEFIKLADLHFRSSEIEGDISNDTNVEARQGLPIIAILMLALACFNYINIAIVSAAKRLKEIGLRKVIGANRRLVIMQFLTENMLLTLLALILGLIFAIALFLPWFSTLTGEQLTMQLLDVKLFVFLLSLLFFTGVASGIYPAIYISKFEAVKIFRGSTKFGMKNTLTKVFLAIQLILTCAGISCAVVFTQNNSFQHNQSWGYDKDDVIYTPIPNQAGYEKLQAVMSQDPDVLSISGSSHHLGKDIELRVIKTPEREYEVRGLAVDANYFETMGIELQDGRFLLPNHESDKKSVVVNEMLVSHLALKEPVGSSFKIDSTNYEIVGVVKDFHIFNFHDAIEPTILSVANPKHFTYMSMRVRAEAHQKAYQNLQATWSEIFPETPFQGGYQQDVWVGYFELLSTAEKFYKVIAFIAVMLASLGLYGLVTLNVAGRIREFSIRKTLGASVKNLASNIGKQYAWLSGLSLLVGIPFSYYMAEASLAMLYAYPMPMSYSGILIAVVILITVLTLVISTQVQKVASFNPVEGLKAE